VKDLTNRAWTSPGHFVSPVKFLVTTDVKKVWKIDAPRARNHSRKMKRIPQKPVSYLKTPAARPPMAKPLCDDMGANTKMSGKAGLWIGTARATKETAAIGRVIASRSTKHLHRVGRHQEMACPKWRVQC